MKKIYFILLMCTMHLVSNATVTFYSKSAGSLNVLSNWGQNTDGSGIAPASFAAASQVFNIRNNAAPTMDAAWSVSGLGSKITIGDGISPCNFTIPAAYTVNGTIDVSSGATLTIQNSNNPTL